MSGAAAIAMAAGLVTIVAAIAAGFVFILRTLWGIKGSWDTTNGELRRLVAEVAGLVIAKDRDHARLEQRDQEIAGRLERHLDWHDRH